MLKYGLTVLAALILALLAYFFIRLIGQSEKAFSSFGLSFIFGNDWDVSRNIYHGAPLVVGTLDHVGDRADHRRPGRRRDGTVRDRAVPATRSRRRWR